VQFVHLPNRLMTVARDLAQENPQGWHWLSDVKLPTSVDLLAPGAPALELLHVAAQHGRAPEAPTSRWAHEQ